MATNNSNDVQVAFELLQEAIEVEIDLLQKEAMEALGRRDRKGAQEALSRADQMDTYRDRVIALYKEWGIFAPEHREGENKEIVRARQHSVGRLQRGLRTPEEAYYRPILIALEEVGGSAEVNEVLTRVGVLMKNTLKSIDYEKLSSKAIRWNHTARWARQSMVEKGLLKSDSPRGIWEITEAGRKYLAEGSR